MRGFGVIPVDDGVSWKWMCNECHAIGAANYPTPDDAIQAGRVSRAEHVDDCGNL